MKCEKCGNEMTRVRMDGEKNFYACRDPKCSEHGKEKAYEPEKDH